MAEVQIDIEAARDKDEYLQGFSDFAHYIASDYSLSIYRKFAVLGSRNLLYLQTELQELEINLEDIDLEDKRIIAESSDAEKRIETEAAARSWEESREQAEDGIERQRKKVEIVYKIRELMKEYGMSVTLW